MIWCLGMYASGSTWLFNTTRQVAATVSPGAEITACYAETLKMLAPVIRAPGLRIVKTHQLDGPATTFMNGQATAILITLRDPRDAVVSLMQHMRQPFAAALTLVEKSALFADRFAADPRAILFKYEDGYIDRPATLARLAMLFGGTLTEAELARNFALSRRAAIEAKIANLEALPTTVADHRTGDVVDLDTQWHRHHANRTGEVGRWLRMLRPHEVEAIEHRLRSWMERSGYGPRA